MRVPFWPVPFAPSTRSNTCAVQSVRPPAIGAGVETRKTRRIRSAGRTGSRIGCALGLCVAEGGSGRGRSDDHRCDNTPKRTRKKRQNSPSSTSFCQVCCKRHRKLIMNTCRKCLPRIYDIAEA